MSREQLLELAQGLREIAAWIEANPDFAPDYFHPTVSTSFYSGLRFTEAAKMLRSFEKKTTDYEMELRRKFSGMTLEIRCRRDLVCHKVKKVVTREVEEWECPDSILAPELPVQA